MHFASFLLTMDLTDNLSLQSFALTRNTEKLITNLSGSVM